MACNCYDEYAEIWMEIENIVDILIDILARLPLVAGIVGPILRPPKEVEEILEILIALLLGDLI